MTGMGQNDVSQDLTPLINSINSRFDALDSRLERMFDLTRLYDPKRCHGHAEDLRRLEGELRDHVAEEVGGDQEVVRFERRHGMRWQVIGIVAAIVLGIGSLGVSMYSAAMRPAQAQGQVAQQEAR